MNEPAPQKMNTIDYTEQITQDARSLQSILERRGAKWLCQTLANICLDHEMDSVDFSPNEMAWIARRKAFSAVSRKMDKIYGDSIAAQIAKELIGKE